MKNDGRFFTRKEQQRLEYEEHFYATWPATLDRMSYEELDRLNSDKLSSINAGYPDTMLWLKHEVLLRLSIFEAEFDRAQVNQHTEEVTR